MSNIYVVHLVNRYFKQMCCVAFEMCLRRGIYPQTDETCRNLKTYLLFPLNGFYGTSRLNFFSLNQNFKIKKETSS